MRFNLPSMPNFLRTNQGSCIGVGELEPNEFEKWLKQYVAGLRKHYEKKRQSLCEMLSQDKGGKNELQY